MWVRDREEGEVDCHSVSRLRSNSLKSAETFFHIKLDVYLEGWDSGLWGGGPWPRAMLRSAGPASLQAPAWAWGTGCGTQGVGDPGAIGEPYGWGN